LTEDFTAQMARFQLGAQLAGYRLEAQVGAGGMAVVYRARDEKLGRPVALKILAPWLAADGAFRRRFVAEARAAAAVDDPYIIPVYEAGEADGVLFIAMRFVRGGDLRAVLEREGALPPARAAAFISPVASALDAAHRAGLVHRDVKPGNILVDTSPDRADHVYLSDFGISKGAMSSAGLTGTGQRMGTAEYMAPERIRGRAVDGRADQYSLACLAFQLLTGSLPFEREEQMAVLYAHMSDPPPSLASRWPGLPAAADAVLAKAMAKEPQNRYGSCGEFAAALREALGLAPYRDAADAAGTGPAREVGGHRPTVDTGSGGLNGRQDLDDGPPDMRPTQDVAIPAGRKARSPRVTGVNYRPITNRPWHLFYFLLSVLLLVTVYGLVAVIALIFIIRNRAIRMNVILALEITILGAGGLALTISGGLLHNTIDDNGKVVLGLFFVIVGSICLAAYLAMLVFCVVQLGRRREPVIPVLSRAAHWLAYGRSEPPWPVRRKPSTR
jgi:serine/threonine protein kinase